MENLQYQIKEFDSQSAPDELCYKYLDYQDKRRFEYDPEEPVPDKETMLKFLRNKHPHYDNKEWIVTIGENADEKIIASVNVGWTKKEHPGYEKNKSTGNLSIFVLKEYRRKQIGTKLLHMGMDELVKHEEIEYIIPGSEKEYVWKMLEEYGGKFSSEGAENRLYLDQVDWDMINTWVKDGETKAGNEGVTLQMFEECPEDILEEYVQIYHETMNQQPLGEWDGEITVTPESFRLDEKRNKERGLERYTLITREKNGKISGLTEIFRHEVVSHRGMQNLTGVQDKYRGRGLGKWLKAEMLVRMKEKFPEWKYITTGNDETNAPMLSINTRMGFKKYRLFKSYKFNVQELKKKVDAMKVTN